MRIAGMIAGLCASIALASAASLRQAFVFEGALTNGTGWTYTNVQLPSSGSGVYFSGSTGVILSPEFGQAITNLVVAYKGASEKTTRAVEVVPLRGSEVLSDAAVRLEPVAVRTSAVLDWPVEMGVTGFRMNSLTGSGTVWLYTADVHFESDPQGYEVPAPPEELAEEKLTGSSFAAVWSAAEGAVSYLFSLWRVDVTSSSWSGVRAECDFADVVNTGGSSAEIKDISTLGGWMSGVKLYAPKQTSGVLQIGSRDDAGCLRLDVPELGAADALIIRAQRYVVSDEGNVMPIDCVVGGVTNAVAALTLGDAMADYEIPLAGLSAGASLLLHSTTNRATSSRSNGRVLLDSVAVVSDYVSPVAATNRVIDDVHVADLRKGLHELETGRTYLWSVTSVGVSGACSEPSAMRSVVPTGPRERLGSAVVFR